MVRRVDESVSTGCLFLFGGWAADCGGDCFDAGECWGEFAEALAAGLDYRFGFGKQAVAAVGRGIGGECGSGGAVGNFRGDYFVVARRPGGGGGIAEFYFD